jgi:hypothetical protein
MLRRRYLLLLAALVGAVGLAVGVSTAGAGRDQTGNGAPSGPHFTLNIHGVDNGQGFNGNNKSDIFVPLGSQGNPQHCQINLLENPLDDNFIKSFTVTDPNCLDDGQAGFSLPAPCAIDQTSGLCTTSTTLYSVWVRALGTPGGSANITTCATDPTAPQTPVCSLNTFVAVVSRTKGKSSFSDVSKDLLFLTVCDTTTGKTTSFPLFSPKFQDFFWDYDNMGLRLAQLRFYQVPSDVPTSVDCPSA